MNVRIKRIDASLPLPQYETAGAAAFDFLVREDTVIPARGMGRAPSNVIIEIPDGYMLWVTDRSGTLKKTGLLITEGVIDPDFCGDDDEILLQFYNPTDADVAIKRGDRVAQGVFLPVHRGEWEETAVMGNKSRGGFGSTDTSFDSPSSLRRGQGGGASGKLIVLYGINNLGKSTQAKLLVDRLQKEGKRAEYIKYARYDLEPSGPMLNEYLRGGNSYQLWPREFQLLGAVNKYHYQPILEQMLGDGMCVVAEDYWGTSVAWGMGAGVGKKFLARINAGLRREDIAFLFDGARFVDSVEQNHKHEADSVLIEKVQEMHRELAREYGWITIDANRPIDVIHELIWERVTKIIYQ